MLTQSPLNTAAHRPTVSSLFPGKERHSCPQSMIFGGQQVTAMPHIIANYSHALLSHRPNLLAILLTPGKKQLFGDRGANE